MKAIRTFCVLETVVFRRVQSCCAVNNRIDLIYKFLLMINCPRRWFLQNVGYKRLVSITWYKHRQYVRRRLRIAGARRICISIITTIKHFLLFSLNELFFLSIENIFFRKSGRIWKSCGKNSLSAGVQTAFIVLSEVWLLCYFRNTANILFLFSKNASKMLTDYNICSSEWSRRVRSNWISF